MESLVLAILGSSGIIGLAFFLLRKYIEKRLTENERDIQKRREYRIKRMQIEDELHHAYGRLFFWMYRAVKSGQSNGELVEAFQALEDVEVRKKDLDREILVACEQE